MDSGPWLSASGANLVNWLQSSPLPGADENSPYSPSVSGTSALLIMRHIHVFCIWTRQRLPNSWTLAGPRSQESGPAPFSPGRGSHQGWKEPLLYRLILIWISCLFRLPNLILNSPASPSMSQVNCGKKPDFVSGCNRWAFGQHVPSSGSQGLPLWDLASLLNVGPRALHAAHRPPSPRSPKGQTASVCALTARAPAKGVSCVPRSLDVWLIIWSSSEGRCDKLGSRGHSSTHWQLKRAFVSWSLTSSGQEPGRKEEGERTAAFPLLAEWPWHPRSKRYGPELTWVSSAN